MCARGISGNLGRRGRGILGRNGRTGLKGMLISHPVGSACVGSVRTLAEYTIQPFYHTKSDAWESQLIWLISLRNTTLSLPAGTFSRNSHFLLCPTRRAKGPFKLRMRGSRTLFPPSYATFHHIVHLRRRCGNISSIRTSSNLRYLLPV